MSVDHQAVYAAELAAFDGTSYESLVDPATLTELSIEVTGRAWWPRGTIEVVAARSDAATSSTRQRGRSSPVVRLAAPQMTVATLIHELAHVLAGVGEGHGPRFRRAHVDLADDALGRQAATWLADAYADHRLALGERTWPRPPARRPTGGPIVL